jgi:hypothetical protein
MDITSKLHVYEALPMRDHIRLIRLEPSLHVEEPFRFCFVTGGLMDLQDQYEAISYTWGKPDLTHPLYYDDGSMVMVTANLDKALRRLRFPVTPRLLWADAVCIDQTNDAEKAQQIPLMARIFRYATRVQGWIGGEAEEERGMQYLAKLSRINEHSLDIFNDGNTFETENSAILPWHSGNETVVGRFFDLPWFSRLWIIQEIVFNNDIILLCGASELTWSRLVSALLVLHSFGSSKLERIVRGKSATLLKIAEIWRFHCNIRDPALPSVSTQKPDNILNIVERFGSYQCSDPRDRIYAVYSMTSDILPSRHESWRRHTRDASRVHMDVNYALDVKDTYQAFASACIRSGRIVSVLQAALWRQFHSCAEDWPSWVPDWRKLDSERPFYASLPSNEYKVRISARVASSSRLLVSLKYQKRDHYGFTCRILQKFETPDSDEKFMRFLHDLYLGYTGFLYQILYVILQHASLFGSHGDLTLEPLDERLPQIVQRELDDYFQNIAVYLNPSKSLPPDHYRKTLAKLTDAIRRAITSHHCFFITSPGIDAEPVASQNSKLCLGYGNATMLAGDHLMNFGRGYGSRRSHSWTGSALILRPVQMSLEDTGASTVSYRLIGTAFVSHACINPNEWDMETIEQFYLV